MLRIFWRSQKNFFGKKIRPLCGHCILCAKRKKNFFAKNRPLFIEFRQIKKWIFPFIHDFLRFFQKFLQPILTIRRSDMHSLHNFPILLPANLNSSCTATSLELSNECHIATFSHFFHIMPNLFHTKPISYISNRLS